MEDILPDAFRRPADETIVERLARTVGRRGVDPAATALQHMNDPAGDTAIISPWFPACVAPKMWPQPCELLVAKPESRSINGLPSEASNHDASRFGKQFMGPEPK